MAGKQNFESLLEYIVNGEQAKAEELFHQLVVAKSREIYENLLDEEMEDEDLDETADEDDDDAVEESADEDDDDAVEESADEEIEEMFNYEEADEDDDSEDDDSVGDDGDASDMGDEFGPKGETDDDGMEFGDDEGGEPTMMDLKSDIEELKDMFAQMLDAERHEEEGNPDIHGGMLPDEEPGMDDMDGEDEDEGMMMPFEEQIDAIDLSPAALMREYVDKVGEAYKGGKVAGTTEGQPVGATNSSPSTTNAKSTVASKNDMGGTAKNIAQGGTEKNPVEANKGELRGSGLLKGKPQDMNTGNVNKVGGTNVKQFYKTNTKGHGAEKKGAGEVGGTDKKSLLGK
jgi:hypothetical protein